MLAARLHEWGSSPSIDEVPAPTPAAGESLVRVLAASVGHLDLTIAGGHFPVSPTLPYIGGVTVPYRAEPITNPCIWGLKPQSF